MAHSGTPNPPQPGLVWYFHGQCFKRDNDENMMMMMSSLIIF